METHEVAVVERNENGMENLLSKEYSPLTLRPPISVADLGKDIIGLHHIYGYDSSRKGNLHFIEDDKLVFVDGSSVVLENIHDGTREFLLDVSECGAACVAVHPSRRCFAVGGRGYRPIICIYSYPELKIQGVLRGGAELGYSCLDFSADGEMLASVSTSPDFMLTIWDWREEKMGLHSKAFGQDVWNVKFSRDDSKRLTTSGIGHIRFWKMASTFTGLKLQGYIGKFGKIDLSDIESFIELPDGKVLSGTEVGSLLLWEGNFIKCQFVLVGGKSCHSSSVTYVGFDREEQTIITASSDGMIKWWDFSSIDSAEVDSDNSMDFELLPLAELRLPEGLGVKSLVDGGMRNMNREFVVLTTAGSVMSIRFLSIDPNCDRKIRLVDIVNNSTGGYIGATDFEVSSERANEKEYVIETKQCGLYHAGRVLGLDCSPARNWVATCGMDGRVFVVDAESRKVVVKRDFHIPATCLSWVGTSLDSDARSIAVGFADGSLRVLSIENDSSNDFTLALKLVLKPHNGSISCLSFSTDESFLASAGRDGTVFFFKCKPQSGEEQALCLEPIRFINLNAMALVGPSSAVVCTQIDWSQTANNVLLSCSDKIAREVDISELLELSFVDNKDALTYEISLPYRSITPIVEVIAGRNGIMKLFKHQQVGSIDTKADGDNGAEAPMSPAKSSKATKEECEPVKCITKVGSCLYSLNRIERGFFGTLSLNSNQHMLCEINQEDANIFKEMNLGLYAADGKDYRKLPEIRDISYSKSKRFLTVSLSDGTIQVRPADYYEVFCATKAHNGLVLGTTKSMLSFDDRFLFSIGNEGCLVVQRVRTELIKALAVPLFKDLDADVFGGNIMKPDPMKEEPKFLSFVSFLRDDPQYTEYFGENSKSAEEVVEVASFVQEVPDIAPDSYSIQDNRLKLEEDAKKTAAEELKTRVKASVRALRKDYEKILKENEGVPELVRLHSNDLMIDGMFFDSLTKFGQVMKEEVHRERAYLSEISEKRVQKLRKRLASDLMMEELCLASFDIDEYRRTKDPTYAIRSSVCEVWSFRIVSLDSNARKLVDQVRSEVHQQELRESQQRSNDMAQKKAHDAMEDMKQRLLKKEDPSKQEGAADKPVESSSAEDASAARLRLRMRKERNEELQKHVQSKPSENDDDERDVMAIKVAEKTIGDFKLKCSDDYEVPEDQRINALKKLRQMALLEESMLVLRLKFNERFLFLRMLKKDIVLSTLRCNARIREIDIELDQEHLSYHLWQPKLNPIEYSDDFEEISSKELSEYRSLLKDLPWEKSNPPQQLSVKGERTRIEINKKTENLDVVRKGMQVKSVCEDHTQLQIPLHDPSEVNPVKIGNVHGVKKYYEVNESFIGSYWSDRLQSVAEVPLEKSVPALSFAKSLTELKMKTPFISAHHNLLVERRRQALLFEREMALKNIESNILSFREAIDELRADRHRITSDLKLSEFKLLTLFQEYRLLLTFEGRDNALHQKQLRCKGEESEIVTLSYDNKVKLETKTEEIQTWNEKLSQITFEFKAILPENHPYIETLTKIFKKKIKRSKPGVENDNEDEEGEEFEDDDDEEEDDEEVEDICPPGCDQALFEKILELREKKLDTEEVCNEIQKCIDDLKKTADRLKQREKQIIKEAQQTEYEVQQFQLQKQAALNQIKVAVPLRLSQIFCFESSGQLTGPMDKIDHEDIEEAEMNKGKHSINSTRHLLAHINMQSHSLFSTRNLQKLKDRIDSLHVEIDTAKDDFRELHKDRSKLAKERELKESETEMWKTRCRELQLLKFGREIDLDELESSSDRSKEREMEGQLAMEREKFEAEARVLLKEVNMSKEQYINITKDNTRQLHELARLMDLKVKIANELNAPGQNVTPSAAVEDFREVEERKRIKAYTRFQATELEALRAELNMLKRKEAPIFSYCSAPSAPQLRSASAKRSDPNFASPPLL
jgi:WD40 repeat protein